MAKAIIVGENPAMSLVNRLTESIQHIMNHTLAEVEPVSEKKEN